MHFNTRKIKHHIQKISSHTYFLPALVIALVALTTTTLLTIFPSTPRPAKLKPGSGDTLYTASNKIFNASIGKKDGTQNITFNVGDSSANFVISGSTPSTPKKSGNTVTFPGSLQNIDLKYTPTVNGLKEEIILHDKPADKTGNTFLFDLNLTNVVPSKLTNNYLSPTFKDKNGNYKFHFEKPYAIDKNGARTNDVVLQIAEDKQLASKYSMKLIVDETWLNDRARAYPITIDPTIVHDTTAEFAAGYFNRVKDTGSGSSPTLESYYQELPSDKYTVGLWHFNEASGNALDSSGNSLTGTTTGTTIVTGLFNNGRQFSGSSDRIDVGNNATLNLTNGYTFETWLKLSANTGTYGIISKASYGSYSGGYDFGITTNGKIYIINQYAATQNIGYSTTDLNTNTWYHLAVTFQGNGYLPRIYINGVEDILVTGVTSFSSPVTTTNTVYIGNNHSATQSFPGIIDEVRISNIARTPEEIKASASRRSSAVYTSPVLDLGGVSSFVTTWNPLTWLEYGVTTGDGETLKDSTGLVAQWNFNSTSGTTATNDAGSCGASCNGTLTSFASTSSQDQAASTGWTSANRRWGAGALMFDGSNDEVTTSTNIGISSAQTRSIEAWIKPNTYSATGFVQPSVSWGACSAGNLNSLGTRNNGFFFWGYSADLQGTSQSPGAWYYVVFTYDGTTGKLYVNGRLDVSANITLNTTNSAPKIGGNFSNCASSTNYFNGSIDSTRIYSRALTPSEILSNYNSGNIEIQTRVGTDASPDDGSWTTWNPTTSETSIDNMDNPLDYATPSASIYTGALIATSSATMPVVEGTKSLKIETGIQKSLNSTVGLWHLDETGGTGAYLKDASSNANNGTPNGTTIISGPIGKGRSFDGSNDYVNLGSGASLDFGNNGPFTHSGWVNVSTGVDYASFVSKVDSARSGSYSYMTVIMANGRLSAYTGAAWIDICPAGSVTLKKWQYIAFAYNGTNITGYVNGNQCGSAPFTYTDNAAYNVFLGSWYSLATVYDFNGYLDEISISNVARSAEEIAEKYRMGRGLYINKAISSTDLSGKTSLPFYVAADRPGSFLSASIGESLYANYQPDSNTVGLWHLDENNTVNTDLFTDTILSGGKWVETDPGTNKIAQNSGLVLTAGTVAAWDSAIVSQETYPRLAGQTIYAKYTSGASVAAPNHMMFGWATDTTANPSYTNLSHGLYINAGTFYIYQDGVLTGGPYLSGYAANTTYEFKITLSTSGSAMYSVKGGAYTDWTTILAADTTKSNTPLRVQVAQYQNVSTFNEITVIPAEASVKDSSGNGNHGTTSGVTPTSGKIGNGKSFNGNSDYIIVPDNNSLDLVSDYSLGAWIYPTVSGNSIYRLFLAKRTSAGATNYQLYLNANAGANAGELRFYNNAEYTTGFVPPINQWTRVDAVVTGTTNLKIFVNGQLSTDTTITASIPNSGSLGIGRVGDENNYHFAGLIDEVRIDNVARTASEIRQVYEIGLRTHPITIDFAANLDSGDLITNSSDLGFTVDATAYGLPSKGSMLFVGDKVIVRENYDGTEYIAQGTVTSITESTGATTIASWDSGSTFPSGGYTTGATIFKWQREYWDIDGEVLDSHLDAITNLTLRLTDGSEGRTIYLDDLRSSGGYLTTPTGSTITSSTGSRYMQYRAILSSFDEAVSATLSAMTLDYIINTAPATPSLSAPSDTATNQILSPIFTTTTTDADTDYLRYKIELCTNVGMSTGCQTFDQTSSQTGWSGQNAQTSTAYTSGSTASYAIQSALSPSTLYYWRSYAIDPAGTNIWSGTQTPRSFTTTAAPTSPTTPYAEGQTNPSAILDLTPEFSAIYNDSDGDATTTYEIDVNANNTFTGTIMWASGEQSMTSTANGVRSPDISYAGTTLDYLGTTYYWRIRFKDVNGAIGAWSTTQNFSLNYRPVTPTLVAPLYGSTTATLLPALQIYSTDGDSDYLRYKIEICTNEAMSTACNTYDQTSSQTNWSGQNAQTSTAYTSSSTATYTLSTVLSPNTNYFWRAYAIDPAGTNTWSTTQVTPHRFTTPAAPSSATSCRIEENPTDTSLVVKWIDNATDEDFYAIERSVDGGSFTTLSGAMAPNTTSFTDNTYTQNHAYKYRIAPYFSSGPTYAEFWCITPSLSFGRGNTNFEGVSLEGVSIN